MALAALGRSEEEKQWLSDLLPGLSSAQVAQYRAPQRQRHSPRLRSLQRQERRLDCCSAFHPHYPRQCRSHQ